MKVLATKQPVIIDIAKQGTEHQRRLAITVKKQNTPNGVIGELEVRALMNQSDIDFLNSQGANIPNGTLLFLNQGMFIPTLAPLQKEFTFAEIDALDQSITYPANVTTRSAKDTYFDLVSAKTFIIQDQLFGGLKSSDFEIIEVI